MGKFGLDFEIIVGNALKRLGCRVQTSEYLDYKKKIDYRVPTIDRRRLPHPINFQFTLRFSLEPNDKNVADNIYKLVAFFRQRAEWRKRARQNHEEKDVYVRCDLHRLPYLIASSMKRAALQAQDRPEQTFVLSIEKDGSSELVSFIDFVERLKQNPVWSRKLAEPWPAKRSVVFAPTKATPVVPRTLSSRQQCEIIGKIDLANRIRRKLSGQVILIEKRWAVLNR